MPEPPDGLLHILWADTQEGGFPVQWIALLVLALASNLDNLGIGIGLGLKRVRLPWTSNALIAGMAALATGLAAYGGRTVALFLPRQMANVLGGVIIIAIGVWVVRSGGQTPPDKDSPNEPETPLETGECRNLVDPHAFRTSPRPEARRTAASTASASAEPPAVFAVFRTPVSADADRSGSISWKEALILGIALGINCLAGGFAAGLTDLSAVGAAVLTAVFSYVLTDLGVRIGHYAGQHWFGRYSHFIAGILLVLLGVYECLS